MMLRSSITDRDRKRRETSLKSLNWRFKFPECCRRENRGFSGRKITYTILASGNNKSDALFSVKKKKIFFTIRTDTVENR